MKAVAVLHCPRCGASNAEFDLRCMDCGEQLSQKSGNAVYPAPHVSETAGRLVGGCELLELLGRGGMGQVYRARQIRTGRIVALKTVVGVEAGLLEGIRREVRALSALRHPDIVRILEHGVQDGLPWYAMEIVRGRTLRAWAQQRAEGAQTWPDGPGGEPWWTCTLSAPISRKAPSPATSDEPHGERDAAHLPLARRSFQEILTLARRLCEPLAYLHGEGLVHRDLKPENVMVREGRGADRGRRAAASREGPVLVDFGLSTAFAGLRGREPLEDLRFGAGTVAYMAPEQIRGEPLDARADLYSLGCVLYELVTGRRPFEGSSAAEVLAGHLAQAPRPPSKLVPEVPRSLDQLILRLLAKEPRQRLGHAHDVAAALAELGAAGDQPEGPGARHPRTPKPRAYLYRSGLAGREQPMRRLEEALSRLQEEGTGGLLLVGGESGVGKTRLLLELSRQADKRGVRVLAGECVPGALVSCQGPGASEQQSGSSLGSPGSSVVVSGVESVRVARGRSRRSPLLAGTGGPLEALRRPLQALADVCREGGLAETERLLGRRGKVLALYEPALRELPGQAAYPEPAELPPAAARLRVYAYLAETLAAFGEGSETVLLLDDLQWADELTLGFLEYWLRAQNVGVEAQHFAPLLVVGAYRSEEVDTGLADVAVGATHASPLRRLIDGAGIVSIGLDRLDEPAVGAIVGDMLALEPPPALFVRHLARHSEGNPFFVAEYLRAMVETGGDGRAPLLWRDGRGLWQVADRGEERATSATYEALPLPTTLKDLVARRLRGLGREARCLAEAAAVLGREAELSVLGPMLGAQRARPLGEEALVDALSELLRRQVLEVPAPGRLRFVHDKIREVAYAGLRKDHCRKLHRAAARAIEGSGQREEHFAALGRHWEEAGDPAQARPCYLAAARHATARYDHSEAERLYRAYLRLVEEPTVESITARNELGEKVLQIRGRNEEALSEHGRALEEARLVGDRKNEVVALHQQGIVCLFVGRQDQAEQLYRQALGVARESDDRRLEGLVLGSLGRLHLDRGDWEPGRQVYRQAIDLHRETGDRHAEAIALNSLGVMAKYQGDLEQARELYEQALDLHREIGDRLFVGLVTANLAGLHWEQGQMEIARQRLEETLALVREVGYRRGEGTALGELGIVYQGEGRLDEAQQLCEQALRIHREVGHRPGEGTTLDTLGNLHQEKSRPEEAQRCYEQAVAIHRACGNRIGEAFALGNLGIRHARQGTPEEARQFHEQALAIHRELGTRRFGGLALHNLACLTRLASGDLAEAARLAEQSEEHLTAMGARPDLGVVLCNRGHIELARGGSGLSFLERAQALAEDTGSGPDSELGKDVSKLRCACEAFEADEHHRLFRGELLEDIPAGLRRWLRETGQLRDAEGPALAGAVAGGPEPVEP